MPLLSCFTGFGFLEFAGEPSEHEKAYRALLASYRDPESGQMVLDACEGTHQEAKIYAQASALGAARVTLRRAANELRAETSYELLTKHEKKFQMTPAPTDTVVQRQLALAAKQKLVRGPRHEAIAEGLAAIFGTDLVEYRPINTDEATSHPADPSANNSPGLFRRPDMVAKTIRLLRAVARTSDPVFQADSYNFMNASGDAELSDVTASGLGQVFIGDGNILSEVDLYLKKNGTPTGIVRAKVYAAIDNGSGYIPTGSPLATSETFGALALTGSYERYTFYFYVQNAIRLVDGTNYILTLEYSDGVAGVDEVVWGVDTTSPSASGNMSTFDGTTWTPDLTKALVFDVNTSLAMTIPYENWNRSGVENRIVAGDILVIDGGDWASAERICAIEAEGDGDARTITAAFRKTHTDGVHGTTGPVPLWSSTKRHVLVVVTADAAIDVTMVQKTNDLFRRVMRAPTTWAIVQEKTPGSGTVGPFAIGDTSGSPLGTTTIEEVTL